MQQLAGHLTYANVMATVAVFIALGGGAWALSRGEVKSKHIAKGAVKKSDLAPRAVKKRKLDRDSVNTRKVIDGSLLGVDFAEGELPQGEPGPRGEPGEAGATNVTRRISDLTTVIPDSTGSATALCLAGERAVGGGGWPFQGLSADFDLRGSVPIISGGGSYDDDGGTPVAWQASFANRDTDGNDTGNIRFYAYAVCAAP